MAAASRSSEDEDFRLATLEAAVMANPNDPGLARRHLLAQYQAGHYQEVLVIAQGRLGLPANGRQPRSPKDLVLLEVAIRAADAVGQTELATEWLRQVPTARRTRALNLLAARFALRPQRPKEARAALDRLISAGESSPTIFVWAAQIAERFGDLSRAEVLYRQATAREGSAARLATLHLARLLSRIDQGDRAEQLLATHLASYPNDDSARRLLAVIRPTL